MDTTMLIITALFLMGGAFLIGRGRSLAIASVNGGTRDLNSLPVYYGTLTALWCGIPCLCW